MQYGDEIALLRDGLSLRRVRSRTGRAINTLRKLRTLFVIWIMDTFPHPPQQPPSANPIPHIPIPQMTTVPTDATGWALMQPVEPHRPSKACRPFSGWCNRSIGAPTPFSKIRKSFRSPGHSKISRAITVKETDEPGTDRTRGTTGEPTIYSWKLKHHNCIGCRIFSYLCREFFEGIAG